MTLCHTSFRKNFVDLTCHSNHSIEVFLNEVCHNFGVAQVFLHIWGMVEWINYHEIRKCVSSCTTVKITAFTRVCATLKLWHTSFRKKLERWHYKLLLMQCRGLRFYCYETWMNNPEPLTFLFLSFIEPFWWNPMLSPKSNMYVYNFYTFYFESTLETITMKQRAWTVARWLFKALKHSPLSPSSFSTRSLFLHFHGPNIHLFSGENTQNDRIANWSQFKRCWYT